MIYEVEGGGVGTGGKTAGGSPIPCSMELSSPTWRHLRAAPRHRQREEQWNCSLCSSPRYHLRTSVEHDYWKRNNTDRVSHPSFGYKKNKDARAPTPPLAALHSSSPPASTFLLLFCFQLLIGRHLICTVVSFSERTGPLETAWYVWESGGHVACTCCGELPSAPPFLHSHCVQPYSVSVAAEKKSK